MLRKLLHQQQQNFVQLQSRRSAAGSHGSIATKHSYSSHSTTLPGNKSGSFNSYRYALPLNGCGPNVGANRPLATRIVDRNRLVLASTASKAGKRSYHSSSGSGSSQSHRGSGNSWYESGHSSSGSGSGGGSGSGNESGGADSSTILEFFLKFAVDGLLGYCIFFTFTDHILGITLCLGPSMLPTLEEKGSLCLVDRFSLRFRDYEYQVGDVVISTCKTDPNKRMSIPVSLA